MEPATATQTSFGNRYLTGVEVRRAFVAFFEGKAHREVPSSSLVPHNDPTVLLTSAGMQQMTPYFLGLETPPGPRLCSVQKCFRTVDIDEVGDESHCTFFFMLGNFSIGDYFKRESLAWSWEFFTAVMGLDPERLYPTVHTEDDDAYAIWRDEIGVPEERIFKLADNWWGPVGATGPNGPDSEIYFDLGPEHGDTGDGPGDDGRYLEVWNNVFMEFLQLPDGTREKLPRTHVDTGMGLERLTLLMQGKTSIYDTDLYQSIIQRAASMAGVTYGVDGETDRALRIIADHVRGSTFVVSDGVLPGHEGRSYVLRRILRRAVRSGRKLGLDGPFLADMASVVIDQFGEDYPVLRERRSQIERVLTHEEESFGRTLRAGEARFLDLVDRTRATASPSDGGEILDEGRAAGVISGEDAFRLYDTYGFPIDLTLDMAREQSFEVDMVGFEAAMATQRTTSRGGAGFKADGRGRAELYVQAAGSRTQFLGYNHHSAEARIVALLGPDGGVEEAEAGETVDLILDRTPFYGESGGQVGDIGTIRTETGVVDIDATFRPTPDVFVHRGIVAEGFVRTGEPAHAAIDASRRRATQRNHTATHLLHKALRTVLGEETHQAGSLVAPDRLRFDFTSLTAMAPEQVGRVGAIVNAEVLADRTVVTHSRSYAEAVAAGAMALFGEKYGDVVRVVDVEGFSQELCGGTHVGSTAEIGPFLVVSEGSVASGVRRIEALTGDAAIERMLAQQRLLDGLSRDLKTPWHEIPAAIGAIQDRARTADRESAQLRGQLAGARAGDLLASGLDIDGVKLLATRVDVTTKDELRQLGDRMRDKLGSGVVALGAVVDGKPSLLVMATKDVVGRGVKAGDIVREIAPIVDGRGGGRPDLAEAGGRDASRLDEAMAAVEPLVRRVVSPVTAAGE